MAPLPRTLIAVGVALVAVGLLLHAGVPLPRLGHLPGDLRIERPGLRLYLPITSSLLVSALLSAALWLLHRLR